MSFDAKNLVLRVALAVVAIPLVLWIALTGGRLLMALSAGLILVAAWEWVRLCDIGRMRWLSMYGVLAPLALGAAWWPLGGGAWAPTAVALVLVAFMLALTGPWAQIGALRAVGGMVLGTFYIGLFGLMVPISEGFRVAGIVEGGRVLATIFAIVWVGDTFAYVGGTTLGRHRLAPRVSPRKSWEGAIFGFIGAVIGAFLGGWLFHVHALPTVELAGIGAFIGVIGQLGDLAESMIKRDSGVKDSSALLPGHGGVLDRFDSFLFSLPVVWGWMLLRPWLLGT